MDDAELEPSELGTHTYWQKAYTKEIINFEDHGDPGDVWFGEDSAYRVIKWICQCGIPQDTSVIDLDDQMDVAYLIGNATIDILKDANLISK
ncbi:Methyltransferase-like protein 10 [Papilio machaon]|uniref:Methyltransferase-like protein 10 n=1 Tax=Papilio machaon TaxID=76193 RepID=A0A0N1PJE9_PAPMA|nr:Methyltransferase-like protein 10 [Papilio machaon]